MPRQRGHNSLRPLRSFAARESVSIREIRVIRSHPPSSIFDLKSSFSSLSPLPTVHPLLYPWNPWLPGSVAALPRWVDSCPFVVKTAVPVGAHFAEVLIAIREGYCKVRSSAASPRGVRVTGKNASLRRGCFQTV